MTISWYPGHMAKAKRALSQQLAHTDVVLELCDARLPLSSRNPDLEELTRHKQRILLLNKADLADPILTRAWVGHYTRQGIQAIPVNVFQMAQKLIPLIEKAAQAKLQRGLERGIRRALRAMVVGVPNVGKSTLINMLKGKATIRTEDRPGVTRSTQWFRVTDYLEIMDSPGLLWPRLDDQIAARRLAYIGSIRDEALDSFHLSIALLEDLLQSHPREVIGRFRLRDPQAKGQALLEQVCRSRGYLLRGAEPDLERAATAVLDEFRSGKVGRITLERPPREDDVEREA